MNMNFCPKTQCDKGHSIYLLSHLTYKNAERVQVSLTLFHCLGATLVLQWPLAWQAPIPLQSAWRNTTNWGATPDHSSCNAALSTISRMHVTPPPPQTLFF